MIDYHLKNDHGLLIYGDTCQNAVCRYFYSFLHESTAQALRNMSCTISRLMYKTKTYIKLC